MFKKALAAGLMLTVMLSVSACGKEPGEASGGAADIPAGPSTVESSTVEVQPTEEEAKDPTEEGTESTSEEASQPTEEAEEEAACSYIFPDMPIAAFEITGLGVGLDVPVCDEHIIIDDNDMGVIPFIKQTPGENTFVLYCFSGGTDRDEGSYYGISRARIHSPEGSSPWEANLYTVGVDLREEFVPEGWARVDKQSEDFREDDTERHETVGDNGFFMYLDDPGDGQFKSLIDPWCLYIRFSEIFHSDAPQPDAIYVVEVVTFTTEGEYEIEEDLLSALAAAFEEQGATVQKISVEEALARDHITVSGESTD